MISLVKIILKSNLAITLKFRGAFNLQVSKTGMQYATSQVIKLLIIVINKMFYFNYKTAVGQKKNTCKRHIQLSKHASAVTDSCLDVRQSGLVK